VADLMVTEDTKRIIKEIVAELFGNVLKISKPPEISYEITANQDNLKLKSLFSKQKILSDFIFEEGHFFYRHAQMFLLITTALLAIIALLVEDGENIIFFFPVVVSALGVFFSVIWFRLMKRSIAYYDCWRDEFKNVERDISEIIQDEKYPFLDKIQRGVQKEYKSAKITQLLVSIPFYFSFFWGVILLYLLVISSSG
jgi:hypothetical protein